MISYGLFSVFLSLGFFLPGFAISRTLRRASDGVALALLSSFLISILVLFQIVFGFELFGVAITGVAVSTVLAGLSLLMFVGGRANYAFFSPPADGKSTGIEKCILYTLVILFVFLCFRLVALPLPGPDTMFRWDFLAKLILQEKHFHFYPPVSAQDFEYYFFIDGIAPLVSICYWWLYASMGKHIPELTALFVLIQNCCLAIAIYSLAARLFSRSAGMLAVGLFYSSRLVVWSTFMGQETGLTALAFIATLLYLTPHPDEADTAPRVYLAAVATAIGMLARQYGGVILICGFIYLLHRKAGLKAVYSYISLSLLFGGFWYLFTWAHTGSPFYGIGSSEFLVQSPVYFEFIKAGRTISNIPLNECLSILSSLFLKAPLVFLIGLPALFLMRRGTLLFSSIFALLFAIWILSIGHTAIVSYSMRVLAPALALLSVLGGGLLLRGAPDLLPLRSLLVLVGLVTVLPYAYVFPFQPHEVPFSNWPSMLMHRQTSSRSELALLEIENRLREGKVLSERQYAHSMLYDSGIKVIPFWNTELNFILDRKMPLDRMKERIDEMDIKFLIHYPDSTFGPVLHELPLYKKLINEGLEIYRGADFIVYSLART